MKRFIVLSAIVFVTFAGQTKVYSADAKEPAPKAFKVPHHGDLQLVVPEGWQQSEEQAPPGLPPALKFSAGAQAEVLISAIAAPNKDFNSPAGLIPSVEGLPLNQKNVNVYIAHAGVWIDVHLSKAEYTEKDKPLFDEIVNGLKIETSAAGK
jgi:hypothetical protein